MPVLEGPDHDASGGNPQFTQTHWSTIVEAGGPTSTEAREALNRLCQSYWYPLYAFIRRRGVDSHKAKDLTQSFRPFAAAGLPEKGRSSKGPLSIVPAGIFDKLPERRVAQRKSGNARRRSSGRLDRRNRS